MFILKPWFTSNWQFNPKLESVIWGTALKKIYASNSFKETLGYIIYIFYSNKEGLLLYLIFDNNYFF